MRRAIGGDEIQAVMIAILLHAIKDYLRSSPPPLQFLSAERYIFSTDKDSTGYVFGFEFICTWLGYDPDVMREKIQGLKRARRKISGRRLVSA